MVVKGDFVKTDDYIIRHIIFELQIWDAVALTGGGELKRAVLVYGE